MGAHAAQTQRDLATHHQHQNVGAAQFADWLVIRGMLAANPARGIALPKLGRPLPKISMLTSHQLLNITGEQDPLAIYVIGRSWSCFTPVACVCVRVGWS